MFYSRQWKFFSNTEGSDLLFTHKASYTATNGAKLSAGVKRSGPRDEHLPSTNAEIIKGEAAT